MQRALEPTESDLPAPDCIDLPPAVQPVQSTQPTYPTQPTQPTIDSTNGGPSGPKALQANAGAERKQVESGDEETPKPGLPCQDGTMKQSPQKSRDEQLGARQEQQKEQRSQQQQVQQSEEQTEKEDQCETIYRPFTLDMTLRSFEEFAEQEEEELKTCLKYKRGHPELLQIKRDRCNFCDRRTNLLSHDCSCCKASFCARHRLPEDHECSMAHLCSSKKRLKQSLLSAQSAKKHKGKLEEI